MFCPPKFIVFLPQNRKKKNLFLRSSLKAIFPRFRVSLPPKNAPSRPPRDPMGSKIAPKSARVALQGSKTRPRVGGARSFVRHPLTGPVLCTILTVFGCDFGYLGDAFGVHSGAKFADLGNLGIPVVLLLSAAILPSSASLFLPPILPACAAFEPFSSLDR